MKGPRLHPAHLFGFEPGSVTHKEKIISGIGAFVGILLTFYISNLFLEGIAIVCTVSSMGATAVLLFGVPHGSLSQPWPVAAGHLLSALIGVICSQWIGDPFWAAPLAVGLAMIAMHYARCIHPPGGATALTAVIGGAQIQDMGFNYVFTPVMLNVITILLVAFVFNGFFKWRRYPALLARRHHSDSIPRESLHFAIRQMDSFIDVSEEDLEEIYTIAAQHAARTGKLNIRPNKPIPPRRSDRQKIKNAADRDVLLK